MKSCHCCGLVQRLPEVPPEAVVACARCETRLKHVSGEKPTNALPAAIALSALILFVPAIGLPFLRIEQLGHMRENSLVGGAVALLVAGHWLAAVAVFVFAIALPPVKLVALLVLGGIPQRLRGKARAQTLRVVDFLGRWGTLDVLILVVAVLLAFVPLGEMVQFQPGPGVLGFGLFVLLSLLAGYFFDPHALWNETPMAHDAEQKPGDESRVTEDQDRGQGEEQAREPESQLPTAHLAKPRGPIWLWLLPILALLVVGALGYREWQRRGTLITVTFSEGHGLEAGDPLRYRGAVVGQVERLSLSHDLNAIQANVRLEPDAERLARDGSRFWVVRPELSLTKVAGLETLVGTNYLAILPGPVDAEPQYHFVGVEEAPLLDIRESGGVNIVLNAADASGLRSGSPIHYRQLRVGGVRDLALASDGSAVEVYAYIRPAFRQLVFPETKFWKSSGVKVKANWSGVTVDMGAAQTLLEPGIALAVPPRAGEPVEQGHQFILHEQPSEEWLAWRPTLGAGTVPENLPRARWALLEWVVPGYLYNSDDNRAGWAVPADQQLIAPQNLLTEPENAQPDSSHLFVAGHRLDLPPEMTEVGEGIGRIKADLEDESYGRSEFREAQEVEDILIVADPDAGPVFVSSADLVPQNGTWLIETRVPLDPSWHGAAAVSVADSAVVGLALLDDGPPRVGLYRAADTEED